MKVISKLLLACLISSSALFGFDELTGDKKLACEAILCLSANPKDRPIECDPAIRKFYSIWDKKPHKTIQKRKNFLKLCPTEDTEKVDAVYANLIDTISKLESSCDPDTLNRNIEKRLYTIDYNDEGKSIKGFKVRVNPNLPEYCKNLSNHSYTSIKLKYTCDNTFYDLNDFNRGYSLEEINKVVYSSLSNKDRVTQELPNPKYERCYNSEKMRNCYKIPATITHYYQKHFINKKCWVSK